MVKWQEVGRVISAVHYHGHQGLKTSEIQKLVRQQHGSLFDFKQALDEAVRTGFLMVRNRRFYPCNWQELVSARKKSPRRLPRGRQDWGSESCTDVDSARRRSSSRSRRGRRRGRGREVARRRQRPSRSYAKRRSIKTRSSSHSLNSRRRRRRSQRSKRQGRKVSRSGRSKRTRGHQRSRAGSDDKIAPDGTNRVTPAEHATGKNYPPH